LVTQLIDHLAQPLRLIEDLLLILTDEDQLKPDLVKEGGESRVPKETPLDPLAIGANGEATSGRWRTATARFVFQVHCRQKAATQRSAIPGLLRGRKR
jgi:hypothetical protein